MRHMKIIVVLIASGITLCLSGWASRAGEPTQAQMEADITAHARDYPHELAAAKAAGLPFSLSYLAKPLPPADQNAATFYAALYNDIEAHPLAGRDTVLDDLPDQRLPLSERLVQAKIALADRSDLIRLVYEATARRQCIFSVDWNIPDPSNLKLPPLSTFRESARLLYAESMVLAGEGKYTQAVRNEALGFQVADHAATVPLLLGYLTATAGDDITMVTLQKIVYLSHGNPVVAEAVRSAIREGYYAPSLVSALRSEVAMGQQSVRFLRGHDYKTLVEYSGQSAEGIKSPSWGWNGTPSWKEFMDANDAVLLKKEIKLVKSADEPYHQAKAAIDLVDKDTLNNMSASHMVAMILLPVYTRLADERAQTQAVADVTSVGGAVLVWKGKHGLYPRSLSQAMPSVPIDPFDSKPLRYRREGKGFIVYSVGPTGKFAGGSPATAPAWTEAVFRYPLPTYLSPAH